MTTTSPTLTAPLAEGGAPPPCWYRLERLLPMAPPPAPPAAAEAGGPHRPELMVGASVVNTELARPARGAQA